MKNIVKNRKLGGLKKVDQSFLWAVKNLIKLFLKVWLSGIF